MYRKKTFLISTLGLFLFLVCSVQAATITVDSIIDEEDGDFTTGNYSLREAIGNATSGDTVEFDGSLFNSEARILTLIESLGNLLIDKDLTISGPGSDLLTISGDNKIRVFKISIGATVVIRDLAISEGYISWDNGAGIYNEGALTLVNCVISHNESAGTTGSGGGIYNGTTVSSDATLNLEGCDVSYNSALWKGGGIFNHVETGSHTASIAISNSSIHHNVAGIQSSTGLGGGGIAAHVESEQGVQEIRIFQSTITDNVTQIYGAGIDFDIILDSESYDLPSTTASARLYVEQSTIANNLSYAFGPAGISCTLEGDSELYLKNSLIAGNVLINSYSDLIASNALVYLEGNNIVGAIDYTNPSVISQTPGDQTDLDIDAVDALLANTGKYDSGTYVFPLRPGSLAIDKGDNDYITSPPFEGPPFYDQRGTSGPGRIIDGTGDSTATVDVGAFEFINYAPSIVSEAGSGVFEDADYQYSITVNDDNPGDLLSVTSQSILPSWLELIDNGDGTAMLSGIPLNEDVGEYSINLLVEDFYGETDIQSFTLAVTNTNDYPESTSLSTFTLEDQSHAFQNADFLAVFSDFDSINHSGVGAELQKIRIDGLPGHGELRLDNAALSIDDEITVAEIDTMYYVPASHYFGTDAFSYSVSDGLAYSLSSYEYQIGVTSINDAPVSGNIAILVNVTGTYEFTASQFVAVYSDVESDSLVSIRITASPGLGMLELDGEPVLENSVIPVADLDNLVYVSGTGGMDSVQFTVNDGEDDSLNASFVSIDVNHAPMISAIDDITIDEDESSGPIYFTISDFESDPGNLLLTITSGNQSLLPAENLNLTDLDNGDYSIDAIPLSNQYGNSVISLVVEDEVGFTGQMDFTVTVSPVNDAPVVGGIILYTDENTALFAIDHRILALANDADPGDILEVTDFDDVMTEGEVALIEGSLSYTPAGYFDWLAEGETTLDVFTYIVSDLSGATVAATISVQITGVNDLPVTSSIVETVDEDTSLELDLSAEDVDTDLLVYEPGAISNGILQPTATAGIYTYIPSADFYGLENFTYSVWDGKGGVVEDTVEITVRPVNDPPVGFADVYYFDEDSGSQFLALLNNDSDIEDDPLFVSKLQSDIGNAGTLFNWGYNVTYSPAKDYQGNFSFTYTVSDGLAESEPVAVYVTVINENDPPVAQDIQVSINEDGLVLQNLQYPVLAAATDVDPDDVVVISTVDSIHTFGLVNFLEGELSYSPGTAFQYLASGETTTDTFTYTIQDLAGATDDAVITVTITGVNDPPVLSLVEEATLEDTAVLLNLTATDVDSTSLSYSVGTPEHGSLESTANPGIYLFNPTADYNGLDEFTYAVSDGIAEAVTNSVLITITPVNDVPLTAGINDVRVDYGTTAHEIDLTLSFTDIEDQSSSMNYNFEVLSGGGLFSEIRIDGGTLSTTFAGGVEGISTIKITVTDTGVPAESVTTEFSITVDPPPGTVYSSWVNDYFTSMELENSGLENILWGMLADPDQDGLLNIWEMICGFDPRTPNVSDVISVDLSDDLLELSFTRLDNLLDLEFLLLSGNEPGSMTVFPGVNPVITPLGDGSGRETVTYGISLDQGIEKSFLSIQVNEGN